MSDLDQRMIMESKTLPATKSRNSKPINDTRMRRWGILAAIKVTRFLRAHRFARFFRMHGHSVFVLPGRLCVKSGTDRDLSEASAMHFIAQHTTIPVPKIHCAFTRKRVTYVVMEDIDGEMICNGWVFRTEESKVKILEQ